MMTQAHVAHLLRDVQKFAGGNPVKLSDAIAHVRSLGWNVVHDEMFAGWLKEQGIRVSH